MSSTILEARQVTGSIKQIGVNGQYTTSLKKSTMIEQGDQITLRNVFIDSAQEATTIEVPSDTTLTLEFIPFATLTSDMIVSITQPATGSNALSLEKLYCDDIYLSKDPVSATSTELLHRSTNFLTTTQTPGSFEGVGDGFQYCATSSGNVANEYEQVSAITVNRLDKTKPWGNTTLSFYYVDENNNTQVYHHHFGELDPSLDTFKYEFPTGTGPIINDVNSFSLAFGSGLLPNQPVGNDTQAPIWDPSNPNFKIGQPNPDGGNIIPPFIRGKGLQDNRPSFSAAAVQGNTILTPVRVKRSIVVKKGQYPPSILANIISRKFNAVIGNLANNYAVTEDLRANPVDPSTPILPYVEEDGNPITRTATSGGFYADISTNNGNYAACSIDDSNIIVQTHAGEQGEGYRLCGGCANFEIDFDNDTQTFKIPKLHTEYQTQSGTAPNIQYAEGVTIRQLGPLQDEPPVGVGGRTGFFYTSYTYDTGCILLTDMTSSRADGVTTGNFWTDTLGFDRSILATVGRKFTPANSYRSVGQLTDYGTARYVPTFDFANQEMGVKRTAPYITPQLLMPNTNNMLNYAYQPRTSPTDRQLILTTDTTQIFSSRTLQAILAQDAFFKIVINGIPSNRLHTNDSVEFVSSIVSKYYSGQSYTNGFSSDSITYVHQGAPVQLSAFDINIYDSTNNPANIGPDNTVFIEITKAQTSGLN